MKSAISFLAVLGLLAFTLPATADNATADSTASVADPDMQFYRLQPEGTNVMFQARHMPFSTFTGRFDQFEAFFEFGEEGPDKVEFLGVVDMTSFQAEREPPIDMTGPDWLDLETYPTSHFLGHSMVMTGENTAEVRGEITMKGIMHPGNISITFPDGSPFEQPYAEEFSFRAEMTVDRTKFGMTRLRGIVRRDIVLTFEGQLQRSSLLDQEDPAFVLPPIATRFLGSGDADMEICSTGTSSAGVTC